MPLKPLISAVTKSATSLVVLALSSVVATQAGAVSLAVKAACATDYYAHCSQHAIGSTGVRQCMRAHGPQLSARCVSALVSAGEVSKAEVDRRRAMAAKKTGSKTAAAD